MRRNGYLWTSGVNLDTTVRFADPDFLLECKISAIWRRFPLIIAFYFWMSATFLFPVCLTYWRRKNTTCLDPHVDNSDQIWSWYVHTLPSYSVFVCWYVTWPLPFCSCHAWRVTWPTLPPSMMTLRLSVLELRVVTFPIDYHWKCVCGHCTCAESRDLWVGGEIRLPDPDLPIHYTTLVALRWIWLKLYVKIIHGPVLKNAWDSAHARNHVIC